MMKAVIYARVSSTDQDPGNQVPVLEGWASSRGFEIVEIYQETDTAWKNGHQAELARLLQDARYHKFEVVLVWALDRLSREGPAAILNLVNTLGTYKVRVISYQEPWTETSTEITSLLYAITGWVAEMESRRRSERTKLGLARAVANGKMLGRPLGSQDKRKRKRRGYLLRYA